MKKLLITGGSGLLGTNLINLVSGSADVVATHNSPFRSRSSKVKWRELDLCDFDRTSEIIDTERPDAIIHAGSLGDVDFVDKNRDFAHKVNVEATKHLLDIAEKHGSQFVFISSNAVFDGNNPPYAEDDPVNPLNYYGELKVSGENMTLEASTRNAVVRPILMYGWNNAGRRGNLATFWLDKLGSGSRILAVDDVWTRPLWAEDAAKVCWEIIDRKETGIFNVCGSEHATLHDFAKRVANVFGYDDEVVEAVPSSHFGNIAKRPRDTSFNTAKIEKVLGVLPKDMTEGLTAMRDVSLVRQVS